MAATVCTLFEGHYHVGLGALVNSLCTKGFRGTVRAGYRGKLPRWVVGAGQRDAISTYRVTQDCTIEFAPIETAAHFTNYKPDFLLQLMTEFGTDESLYFYIDPDITINVRWTFFEEWARVGVAMCEDVNSPMPESHPVRAAWREFCARSGIRAVPKTSLYVNGGFLGVHVKYRRFVEAWANMMALQAPAIGGLQNWNLRDCDRTYLFYRTDQDALNMAIEASDTPVSFVGKDGMGFERGSALMFHAIGGDGKPWRKSYLRNALKGHLLSPADWSFWNNALHPIRLYSDATIRGKMLSMKLAALTGRIIGRS